MSKTITLKPGGYTGTSVTADKGSVSDLRNAYDGDSTSYALFHIGEGVASTGEALTYYVFDFSVIPQDANIQSISMHSKAKKAAHVPYSYFSLSLFAGTTFISTKRVVTETTGTTNDALLTESEILSFVSSSSPRIRVSAETARRTLTLDGYLYDLYLEVTYELPSGLQCKVKVNGSWVETEVFVKVNDEWVNPVEGFVKVNDAWKSIGQMQPNNFTFYINSAEYLADNGMTWADWVQSDYNTIGAISVASGDAFTIRVNDKPIARVATVTNVVPTDPIIENEEYTYQLTVYE